VLGYEQKPAFNTRGVLTVTKWGCEQLSLPCLDEAKAKFAETWRAWWALRQKDRDAF
jgi:hypothetical protein